jgi:hypothetical protein
MACKYNVWSPKINESDEIKGRKNVKRMKFKLLRNLKFALIVRLLARNNKNNLPQKPCFN